MSVFSVELMRDALVRALRSHNPGHLMRDGSPEDISLEQLQQCKPSHRLWGCKLIFLGSSKLQSLKS